MSAFAFEAMHWIDVCSLFSIEQPAFLAFHNTTSIYNQYFEECVARGLVFNIRFGASSDILISGLNFSHPTTNPES